MEIKNTTYIKLLLFHVLIGFLVFFVPVLSKIIAILLFFLFSFIIIKKRNANNEALIFAAYSMASEVFFRMTHGAPNSEFGKYSVIFFLILGIYYVGFSKKSFLFLLSILFLIPGVFIGVNALDFDVNIRKAIVFNMSGPICLAIASIYTFKLELNKKQLETLITVMIFPVISMVTYMYLYTPSNRDIFTGTESNFQTSGGFGPNQVSTIIGLGMFVVFIRLILYTKSLKYQLINIFLLVFITYRGILTFSRGGIFTAVAMILAVIFSVYFILDIKGKLKINLILITAVIAGIVIFVFTSLQTGGMISKRYEGKDALGREKVSKFSGREKLIESELNMFLDNPFFGVGVGVNKQYREELTGIEAASHNEITRLLAEHGLFGVLNLLILIFTPIVLYFTNKQNIFLLSFYLFWLLTINHAAMRIAAPAFVYALTLLKVSFDE